MANNNNKRNLFDEDGSDDGSSSAGGEAQGPATAGLKINEEYARRFEHNKKRAEMHRLEEKYKTRAAGGGGDDDDDDDDDDASSSEDDETEDEDGFLATEELDAEISATLQAIKNKDPRIYDKEARFFRSMDDAADGSAAAPREKKAKPMFLHDYHRERYMAGDTGADEGDDEEEQAAPRTFVQEQADLKQDILAEINAAAGADEDEDGDEEDTFIRAKPGARAEGGGAVHPSRQERIRPRDLDPSLADKDPELYLSNFMASRAWAAAGGGGGGHQWQAFESDEGEGDDDADEWEAAYNLRFEDPAKSNEVLMSYSRKVVEARTVRREELKGRRRQRELERERRAEEKRLRHEERARLRRLKVEEAEDKLRKIRKAAGLKGRELREDEWMQLLDAAWENDQWEEEMNRRFGDEYYAEADESSGSEEEGDGKPNSNNNNNKKKKKTKPKKPRWDDDIDIKDIIPDFEDEETRPNISLSDDSGAEGEGDQEGEEEDDDDDDDGSRPSKKRRTTARDHKAERQAARRAARQERSKLEALVGARMELDDPTALAAARRSAPRPSSSSAAAPAGFRYRETSPQSFGLTARDILLAPSDAALNEFAGLKKLATWRDAEKKRKDRKRLGKKARLREWRREVFGREFEHSGPTFGFGGGGGDDEEGPAGEGGGRADERAGGEGKKRKKRSKGKKKKEETAAGAA